MQYITDENFFEQYMGENISAPVLVSVQENAGIYIALYFKVKIEKNISIIKSNRYSVSSMLA